jgi:hypothetical protein
MISMPKLHAEMEMEKVVAKGAQVKAGCVEHIRKEEQKQEQEQVNRKMEFNR